MNEIITTETRATTEITTDVAYSPIVARQPIAIRAGTLADFPFIDRLQKQQSREVGFLPMAALEGKVKLGQVLIARS